MTTMDDTEPIDDAEPRLLEDTSAADPGDDSELVLVNGLPIHDPAAAGPDVGTV